MSSASGKNIFGTSGPPSREELEQYLDGNMSSAEMHATEVKLADDPFAAEAMEGFEANPGAIGGMTDLQQQFDTQLAEAPTGGGSGGMLGAGKGWVGATVLIAAGAIITLSIYNLTKDPVAEPTPEDIATNPVPDTDEDAMPVPFSYMEMEEMTDSAIDVAVAIPSQEQVTYEVALENQPETIEEPLPVLENPDPLITPALMDSVETLPAGEIENEVKKVIQSNVAIAWINKLKVVDYSEFYKSPISKSSFLHEEHTNHLEAPFETHGAQQEARENPEIIVTYTPYMEFLTGAMDKFNKNDFKAALKDYKTILKFYPDDANAHFYGGLCYYNIGEWKKAVQHFDAASHNQANTFRQEARWYMAKAYLQRRKDHKARPILIDIVKEDGFYATQARVVLDKIGWKAE